MEYVGKFVQPTNSEGFTVSNIPQDGKDLLIILGIKSGSNNQAIDYATSFNESRIIEGQGDYINSIFGFIYGEGYDLNQGFSVFQIWIHNYSQSGKKTFNIFGGVTAQNSSGTHLASFGEASPPTSDSSPVTSFSVGENRGVDIRAGSYMKIWKVTE